MLNVGRSIQIFSFFTIIVSVGLLTFFSGCNPNTRAFVTQPNIVFILVDDLGSHQLGSYGSTFYETPNIDELANEGIKFTNAYAASTVCSPTRASIMTGKYPARLHLTDYIPGNEPQNTLLLVPNWTKQLLSEEITIPEVLKSAGYATGHFGKWHLN
ncbi:MAG: sulfatase-like hydrolase/transferase, partial [Bacteroidales bacterium]|nr:sulfatase-like hydrolase/transferase [Bacteroidales bacterium]